MKRDSVTSVIYNNLLAHSLQLRVAYFYAESNGIFVNFLRLLLNICIQIKWICQIKRDSLASLVHNNLFRSLVTTTGCVFLWWIQWYFWKCSTTIIKDLYKNRVNCATYKNIQKYYGALLPVLYVCVSFRKSYGIYSYILFSLIKWRTNSSLLIRAIPRNHKNVWY